MLALEVGLRRLYRDVMIGPSLLFIAGMPASGKSFFGRWLEAHHGYVHIDPEENSQLDTLGVRDAWNVCWSTATCGSFATRLMDAGTPVVFNWGFPPHLLRVALALTAAGFSSWWFDAPITAARAAYTKDPSDFARQAAGILANRDSILDVFRPNVLMTLDASGKRTTPAAIWSRIRTAQAT